MNWGSYPRPVDFGRAWLVCGSQSMSGTLMYSYSPTIANNKPHLPVITVHIFSVEQRQVDLFVFFLLLTLWATNPFLFFCRQHQESHQWALSEDPSKNLHDTVLVSPESEIRLGMDFGCYTRLLQDISRFLEDFLFPKKRVRLETGYTPNIHPMSSTSEWPTLFAIGFLGNFSTPKTEWTVPPDVPWPGYVNFSGEKKDDDYKAPQRHLWEFGPVGMDQAVRIRAGWWFQNFPLTSIFFKMVIHHVKTTNFWEMTSWRIRDD